MNVGHINVDTCEGRKTCLCVSGSHTQHATHVLFHYLINNKLPVDDKLMQIGCTIVVFVAYVIIMTKLFKIFFSLS